MARIRHIALTTENPSQTAEFYKQAFGLKELRRSRNGAVFLTDGYIHLAVLNHKDERAPDMGAHGPNFSGIHHFGFAVDDLEEASVRLEEAHAERLTHKTPAEAREYAEPRAGHANFEMKWSGPDGVVIDISHTGWEGSHRRKHQGGRIMAANYSICIGTIGTGAWVSPNGGEGWRRIASPDGLWGESRIYGLATHPSEPRTIFAGADTGIYRSTDGGQRFMRLDSPMNAREVWKIALDPTNPDIIFAGTRPAGLYRSIDGGQSWVQLSVDMAEECPNVRVPRVTALAVDPANPRQVWAGVEVDGVRRSLDGGETWTRIESGVPDPDIHDVTINRNGSSTVLTTTPREIFSSGDGGETWAPLGVNGRFRLPYCRQLTQKVDDPKTLFVATGDGAAGFAGGIQRTRDGGESWEMLTLPVEPNSPIWGFAVHPANAERIVACSHYGELFASENGGDTWVKLPREFSEIRAVAWVPN